MLELNPFSALAETVSPFVMQGFIIAMVALIAIGTICLLYTSDAADEEDSVDLGGRRIIKKI